jgi:hypothetical protein
VRPPTGAEEPYRRSPRQPENWAGELLKDWAKFALAFQELPGWFGVQELLTCPQCNSPQINRADAPHEELMMISTSRGMMLPIRCGTGHAWKLRVSSWWDQAADADLVWERHRQRKLRLQLKRAQSRGAAQVKPKKGRDGKTLPDRALKKGIAWVRLRKYCRW